MVMALIINANAENPKKYAYKSWKRVPFRIIYFKI
jgi:L-asparagine transporter-like permease